MTNRMLSVQSSTKNGATARKQVETLLLQTAQRDRAAFDALYAMTSAKLFGVCLRILGDRALAEDALQEAFIRIWDRAGLYQVNGLSPMTWLITIARNIAIDRKRRQPKATSSLDFDMPSEDKSPEQAAVDQDEARRLDQCFDELPENRGAAVRLVYLDGASYADLAEHYNVPLNTMRTWLRRSLLALRECLSR